MISQISRYRFIPIGLSTVIWLFSLLSLIGDGYNTFADDGHKLINMSHNQYDLTQKSAISSPIYFKSATIDYLGLTFFYPPDWVIQPLPYMDFGFRISSPGAEVDAIGRILKGAYITTDVVPEDHAIWLQTYKFGAGKHVKIAGVDGIRFTGFIENQYPYVRWEFFAYGHRHSISYIGSNGDFATYKKIARNVILNIRTIGRYSPEPTPPNLNFDKLTAEFPDLLHAFPSGYGKIMTDYNANTHTGGDDYGLDLCEGKLCNESHYNDIVIAPTDIKYVHSINGWHMSTDSKDYHFFEISDNLGNDKRLCMTLGHFLITIPEFVYGKRLPRGAQLGRIVNYTTQNHIHIALFTIPRDRGCAAREGRIAVPFDSNDIAHGGISLDRTDFPINSAQTGREITSSNAPLCAVPQSLLVSGDFISGIASVGCDGGGLPDPTPNPTVEPTPNPTQPPSTPPPSNPTYTIIEVIYPQTVNPGQSFTPSVKYCLSDSAKLVESRGDMLRNTDGNLYGMYPHVAVTGTVSSGQCFTFLFYTPMTAPNNTGTYDSRWQLWVNGSYVPNTEVNLRFTVQNGGSSGSTVVTLHDNPDYHGEKREYGVGKHDIGGSWNDKAHSVTVPSGMSVRLYEHSPYQGQNMCFTSSNPSLPGPYAEGVSSLVVYSNTNCQETGGGTPGSRYITLFDDPSFKGEARPYGTGRHDIGSSWNDRAHGVDVPVGMSVRLYQHGNFDGQNACFAFSVGSLPDPYKEGVSSLVVYDNPDCNDNYTGPMPMRCGWVNAYDSGGNLLSVPQTITNLAAHGWNDKPRTIEVNGPFRVTAYDGENFSSPAHGPFYSGINPVGTNVSSIKVERLSNCPDPTTEFPSQCAIGNPAVVLVDSGNQERVINTSIGQLATIGWNDRPREIYVRGPFKVMAYDGENFEGYSHGPFYNGDRRTVGTNVTSVRIELAQDCTRPIPKPDLVAAARPGAAQIVIASRTVGNRNQDTLIAGQTAYFDWGVANIGESGTGTYRAKIWIGDQPTPVIDEPLGGLGGGQSDGRDDVPVSWPNAGCFNVRLVLDTENQVSEVNEGNNAWTSQICWVEPVVAITEAYTTDGNGPSIPPAILNQTIVSTTGIDEPTGRKTVFNVGDVIKLYTTVQNTYATSQVTNFNFVVTDATGRMVPALSGGGAMEIPAGGSGVFLPTTIPSNSLDGEYKLITTASANGRISTASTAFQVNGLVDNQPPSAFMTAPSVATFLNTNAITLSADAMDNLSGVKRVDFYVWSQASWSNGEWKFVGSDETVPYSVDWSTVDKSDSRVYASARVFDYAGNAITLLDETTWTWFGIDRTTPISRVDGLPAEQVHPQFTVNWTRSDNLVSPSWLTIEVQVQLGCLGNWTTWLVVQGTIAGSFEGEAGQTYCFRSRAVDAAGNVEAWPNSPDARTKIKETVTGVVGRVFEQDGVTPITVDVWVDAFHADDKSYAAYTSVNPDGTYVLPLSPGQYIVLAKGESRELEYYDNSLYWNTATVIAITDGQSIEDVDFALGMGGTISGVVTDGDGLPIPNIAVDIENRQGYGTCTGSDGKYTLKHVALSTPYKIHAGGNINWCNGGSTDYQREYWQETNNASSATPITLTSGQSTKTGINFTLSISETSDNLVKNPGFEVAGKKPILAANWQAKKLKNDKRICNPNAAKSGNCFFQFTAQKGTSSIIIQNIKVINAQAGDLLTFSAWASGNKLRGMRIQARVNYTNGTSERVTLIGGSLNAGTYAYKLLNDYTLFSNTVQNIKIEIRQTNGNGRLRVDDVSLLITKNEEIGIDNQPISSPELRGIK